MKTTVKLIHTVNPEHSNRGINIGDSVTGMECQPPRVGQRYELVFSDSRFFLSGTVLYTDKTSEGTRIVTRRSIYLVTNAP